MAVLAVGLGKPFEHSRWNRTAPVTNAIDHIVEVTTPCQISEMIVRPIAVPVASQWLVNWSWAVECFAN